MEFKDTFCSAPWAQVRMDWDGKFRPCCMMKIESSDFKKQKNFSLHNSTVDEWMSSDYLQHVRQQLGSGNRIPECKNCWSSEDQGLKSMRQIMNDYLTDNRGDQIENTWIQAFVNQSVDQRDYYLISADVKVSNVCNFACAMCDPCNSSRVYDRWKAQPSVVFVQEVLNKDPEYLANIANNYQTQRGYKHLQSILDKNLKYLKFLGGEPLLDKELFRILEQVPAGKQKNITLYFVTNGSQDLIKIKQRLSGYKKITFTISLEGIGKMQDYTRNGSEWEKIEQNILQAKNESLYLTIHHTVQATSILRLHELLSWCHQQGLPISLGVLEDPEYLKLSVLPSRLQQLALDRLSDLQEIKIVSDNDTFDTVNLGNIRDLISNIATDSELFPKFLEYIRWYEQDKSLKLKDICPEFYTG